MPRNRAPRVRKRRPASAATRAAESQRRQQRREKQKAERAARVDALLRESDRIVAADPARRPLQRRDAEYYERQQQRGQPAASAARVIQIFERLERQAAEERARQQALEEQTPEEQQAREQARQQVLVQAWEQTQRARAGLFRAGPAKTPEEEPGSRPME